VNALTGISSIATRYVLAELAAAYPAGAVAIESIGGVDAVRRVQAGEAFDIVVLAAKAIDELAASAHVLAGSRVDLARSRVALAVRSGAAHPDVRDADALRRAIENAARIGYSTGPSGAQVVRLLEGWGIDGAKRLVQAPPGVPVASLLARGEVDLGFQQLSELVHESGIEVLGPLPEGIDADTVFSGGICARSPQPDAARELLRYLASPQADAAKRRHGMQPAR
jgi:molybdate transport system substrate-binding protein